MAAERAEWFRNHGLNTSEVYSPPRIAREAGLGDYGGMELRLGWSLDLTTNDPEAGKCWDLSDGCVRTKAMNIAKEAKPFMFVCSPMCTACS